MSFLINKAIVFASLKHGGTTRKFGNAPYVTHPIAVAMRLARMGYGTSVIVAALLHDTVEDTDATLDEIEAEFGLVVRHYVDEVTSDKAAIAAIDSPNAKGERLAADMSQMSEEAFAIKLADREHNVSDLGNNVSDGGTSDIDFSIKYARSTHYILSNIRRGSAWTNNAREKELIESIKEKIAPYVEE